MKKFIQISLIFALCIGLFACNNTSNTTPGETVSSMLNDFKNQNFNKLGDYFDGKISLEKNITMNGNLEDTKSETSFLNKITDIDYEILDETISEDGSSATVIVKITSHNIAEKLLEGVTNTLPKVIKITTSGKSAKEIKDELFNSVFSPLENTEKNVINSIEVYLKYKDNKWKISSKNSEFLSSITGGLMDIMNKFNFLTK